MRILFAGTSDIAVKTLEAVAGSFEVTGVLTGSDKPAPRTGRLESPPVKLAADRLGIPIIQCDHVRGDECRACRTLEPDFLLCFSFGRIFGPRFLSIFKKTMNIHPSPLPIARGPAPVQAAILTGSRQWAISFQEIGLGMDCGRLYDVLKFNLDGRETTVSLTAAIAELAAERCLDVLRGIEGKKMMPCEQQGDPSCCRMVEKADGLLDFSQPALAVHARIRAMYDWPKAFTTLGGEPVMITGVWGGFAELDAEEAIRDTAPGTIMEIRKGKGIKVACADKAVWLTRFQIPTKREISFVDFANQKKNLAGRRLGT